MRSHKSWHGITCVYAAHHADRTPACSRMSSLLTCTGCADACGVSPGRMEAVINVAATDSTDARWSKGNYGTCVDIYAPGVDITSSVAKSTTATLLASGTSMACPHVTGAAAQYLQLNTTAPPQEVRCRHT